MSERFIYADNAATTRVSECVLAAMTPYLRENYGNPNSIYGLARQSRRAVEHAREQVAAALHAKPAEIYFTSCGTESDNWAIRGYAKAMRQKGKTHIITSSVEHHAVLYTCQWLEKEGYTVTYLPVDADGLLTAEQVEDAITEETGLVTIMAANNEIGTIYPIREIGEVCRRRGVIFHTDAVQAVGNVAIDVEQDKIDMLSISGHKLHAPKGIGALYIRSGVRPASLMTGGGQEHGRRPGTENVAYIVGLGQAIEDANERMAAKQQKVSVLRDRLIDGILSSIPAARLNGSRMHRLCGNVNISFEGIEGESILLWLDENGIAASSGSACTSGSLDPSHVLLAIGLPHSKAHGSLRLTINEENTMEDVEYILEVLPDIIARLRKMSPIWDEKTGRATE